MSPSRIHHINFMAHSYTPYEGYGRYARYLLRALHENGVCVKPIAKEMHKWPGDIQSLTGVHFTDITLSLMPGEGIDALPGRQWGYSMCEATRIPQSWVTNINRHCERVLVPCQANAVAFSESGVEVPIHIIPGGTSPADYERLPDVDRERPYTFLVIGDRGARKGFEIAYTAFHIAFGGDPERFPGSISDVRLLIKTRALGGVHSYRAATYADRRISVMRQDVDSMTDVYALVDCMVFPSFYEGWGMPPREAAMRGLPVLATRIGGLEDGLDHWAIPIDKFKMGRATLKYISDGTHAEWAVPDIEEVARLMRWCYDHREDAKTKGRAAATWLRQHQTWNESALALKNLLDSYA